MKNLDTALNSDFKVAMHNFNIDLFNCSLILINNLLVFDGNDN